MTTTTTETQATVASPAKLRSGAWGARVHGTAQIGQQITIRTAGGKTWDALVTAIVWSGADATIVATRSLDRAPTSSAHRHGSCSCDDSCCEHGCRCDAHCNCRGGNIYDC